LEGRPQNRKDASGRALVGEALLLEKDSRVREAIFTSLVRMATPQSALTILPHLRSDDATLRTGALDALRMMPEATQPHLKALLGDPDADVRLLACDLVRAQSPADATQMLTALLETEPEPNVCAAAVDVLAEVCEPAAPLPLALRRALPFRPVSELRHQIRHRSAATTVVGRA